MIPTEPPNTAPTSLGTSRSRRAKVVVQLLLVTGALVLAACGSSSTSSSTTTTSGASATTKTTVPRHVLVATYADNGGTLTVQVHDRLRVVLAGKSWTQSSSNPSVVVSTSKPTVLPVSSGCVTGQGCGSVTVFYQARKLGTSQIEGSRASCDSANQTCTTGPGAFRMKVVVAKQP
jgi:hypothetical protein